MSQKKVARTVEYENTVKTAIMDDAVARQLNEDLENLQQNKFDSLIRSGTIVPVDMSFIFEPSYGINWITT